MKGSIKEFCIYNLHGYKNYEIKIRDNRLVLIGENGAGKTTVLRILFYLLTGQLSLISQYKFDLVSLNIDGEIFRFSHDFFIERFTRFDQMNLQNFPPSIRQKISEIIIENNGRIDIPELENLLKHYDIPVQYIFEQMDYFDFSRKKKDKREYQLIENLKTAFTSTILYLPTYRRIEQELGSIIKGMDAEIRHNRIITQKKESTRFIELIEFGMKDVDRSINTTLEKLKEFSREGLSSLTFNYLGDVVDKNYMSIDVAQIREISEEKIVSVLDRITENVLSSTHKNHLLERLRMVRQRADIEEDEKVICHYFLKLVKFEEALQENEKNISDFCRVCNGYLVDKELVYDSKEFSFKISSLIEKDRIKEIILKDLSSGEKQIVSLFSQLYLSGDRDYFVLIDEPELSLSVTWQRKFLIDIQNGKRCSGLIAVTHSPFIYDNELKNYAYSLGEFEV